MKDFQKFCDSLDQAFIDSLSVETSYVLNADASFGNTIMANDFAITMRVLERYHEWLHSETSEYDL